MKLITFASVLLVLIVLLSASLALTASSQDKKLQQENTAQEKLSKTVCGEQYVVYIENGNFYPASVELEVGDSLLWINKDEENHLVSVESCGDHFVPAHGSEEFTFTQPGFFSYLWGEGNVMVR